MQTMKNGLFCIPVFPDQMKIIFILLFIVYLFKTFYSYFLKFYCVLLLTNRVLISHDQIQSGILMKKRQLSSWVRMLFSIHHILLLQHSFVSSLEINIIKTGGIILGLLNKLIQCFWNKWTTFGKHLHSAKENR